MNNLVLNSAGTTDLIFLVNGGSSILHMMPWKVEMNSL
jgi:hypothetical protein